MNKNDQLALDELQKKYIKLKFNYSMAKSLWFLRAVDHLMEAIIEQDNGLFDDGTLRYIKRVIYTVRGLALKEKRISLGLSIRGAAKKYGIDYSNLHKMEEGKIKPRWIYE